MIPATGDEFPEVATYELLREATEKFFEFSKLWNAAVQKGVGFSVPGDTLRTIAEELVVKTSAANTAMTNMVCSKLAKELVAYPFTIYHQVSLRQVSLRREAEEAEEAKEDE